MEQVQGIDAATLIETMRRVPSPVTVLTTVADGEVRGATIGSFTSVSLAPPLISFNVKHGTQMHDALEEASYYTVHVLSDTQAYLSNHFAIPDRSGDEQFGTVPHEYNEHGVPVLDHALVVLHCRAYGAHPAGDHTILVGEVLDVQQRPVHGQPLIYFNRTYRSVGEEVQSILFASTNRESNTSS